ncbi:hypothetical protein CDD82_745 [Ophiocordyceps australis]|uniref:Uncharacterized protein n=1 Tax=Ophiocordyceps australis TaxID=1399860 RepID=A0A2C5YFA9_9HYPO|nr:hypothetical protein CDD82_745 [Ophiocordyceps australis]
MATSAQTEPAPHIKQEDPDPDASLHSLQAPAASSPSCKRPMQEPSAHAADAHAPKRQKTDVPDALVDEVLFEQDLALLVQNALSNMEGLAADFAEPTARPGPNRAPTAPVCRPRPAFALDPVAYMREASLHALGNLALCILVTLLQPPLDNTMKIIRNADSHHARVYTQLKSCFYQTRLLYSSNPVLSLSDMPSTDNETQTLMELTNLAQLAIWLLDGGPAAMAHAHQNFLLMFNCHVSHLPQGMAELYLDIMTQRAIESLIVKEPDVSPETVLDQSLMAGLETRLREQHGGDELTSADQSFVSSVQARKESLQAEAKEQPEPTALRQRHPVDKLLPLFNTHVRARLKSAPELGTKFEMAIDVAQVQEPALESGEKTGDNADFDDLSTFFEKTASGLVQNAMAGLGQDSEGAAITAEGSEPLADKPDADIKTDKSSVQSKMDLLTDYQELEALVAESTSNYVKTTLSGMSPVTYQPMVPPSTTESMAAQNLYMQHMQQQPPAGHGFYSGYSLAGADRESSQGGSGDGLPPNQSCSSADLYDKARQAALSKSSAHTRREGSHSTRRPWTQEEEKALMTGLDIVKGPHWSQILQLFGPSGSVSDILRDRTQVQLKDKARNLKLFFLKTNSEMPYYLQAVTGELKTRAPTQAARKEAEERARLNSDEEQAKLQGMVQNYRSAPPQHVSGSPIATAVTPGQPPQAQGQPSQTLGQPLQTQGQPSQTLGQPLQTQGQPLQTQGQPLQTQGQPLHTQVQLSQTQGQPHQSQSQPGETQGQAQKPSPSAATPSQRPLGSPAPAPMTAAPAQRPAGIPALAPAPHNHQKPVAGGATGGPHSGSRPMATTQQVLQSMPQPPPRPQTQLPPRHISPRPPTPPARQTANQHGVPLTTGSTDGTGTLVTGAATGASTATAAGSTHAQGQGRPTLGIGSQTAAYAAHMQMQKPKQQVQPGQAFVQAYRPQAQASRPQAQVAQAQAAVYAQAQASRAMQTTLSQGAKPQAPRQQAEAQGHGQAVSRAGGLPQAQAQTSCNVGPATQSQVAPADAAQTCPTSPQTPQQQAPKPASDASALAWQGPAAKSTSAGSSRAGAVEAKPLAATSNGAAASPASMAQRQEAGQKDKAAETVLLDGFPPAVAQSLA